MALELRTRYMTVKLILDNGKFPPSPDNQTGSAVKIIKSDSTQHTVTIEAQITKEIGFQANHAYLTIYGLLDQDIAAFSRFRRNLLSPISDNSIEIYAGYSLDSSGTPPFVFKGTVMTAGSDYNNPSRPFLISAIQSAYGQQQTAPMINLHGDISLNSVLNNIASNNNLIYQPSSYLNNIVITNPLFFGTFQNQLDTISNNYGLSYSIDANHLYVSKKGFPYSNAQILINSDNNLLGYPVVNDTGVDIRVRFNPIIQLGQKVSLRSIVAWTNSDNWYVNALSSNLQTKGQMWESHLTLNQYPIAGLA